MKRLLLILTLIILNTALAQGDIFKDILNDSTKGAITLNSYAAFQSNTLTSELLGKFLFGGFINEEIKSENMIRLRDFNFVNGVIEGDITYYDLKSGIGKNKQFAPFISLNSEFNASARLTDGTIDLLLNGNKRDTTYNFNSDFIQTYFSQSLSFGMIDKESRSFLSIGIVNGTSFSEGIISKGSLSTDANGNNVLGAVKGNYKQNYNGNNALSSNGIGFVINGAYNFNLPFIDSSVSMNFPMQISVNNFGMIFWDQTSQIYSFNGATNYQGYDPNSDQDLFNQIVPDSLITESSGRHTTLLIGSIGIHKLPDWKKRRPQAILGVDIPFNKGLIAQLYAGLFFAPNDWFNFSASVKYGYRGGIQDNIVVNFRKKNKYTIGIYSDNVISALFTSGFGYSCGFSFGLLW